MSNQTRRRFSDEFKEEAVKQRRLHPAGTEGVPSDFALQSHAGQSEQLLPVFKAATEAKLFAATQVGSPCKIDPSGLQRK